MFNLSGSELIFLVLIALVVLGPDKLPEAMRKAGKAYADFKKMTTGFQSEMKSVLDEPMRELRETAELAKKSAMFDFNDGAREKPVSAKMATQTPDDGAAARRPARVNPTSSPNFSSAAPSNAGNTAAMPTADEQIAEPEIKNAPVASGNMWAGRPPANPILVDGTGVDPGPAEGAGPPSATEAGRETSAGSSGHDAADDAWHDATDDNAAADDEDASTAGEVPA